MHRADKMGFKPVDYAEAKELAEVCHVLSSFQERIQQLGLQVRQRALLGHCMEQLSPAEVLATCPTKPDRLSSHAVPRRLYCASTSRDCPGKPKPKRLP